MLLKTLVKGVVAQFLAYGVFGLGFWLLLQGFVRPNAGLGVLGGGMVILGMFLLVAARRLAARSPSDALPDQKEGNRGDPIEGRHQGDKLSP